MKKALPWLLLAAVVVAGGWFLFFRRPATGTVGTRTGSAMPGGSAVGSTNPQTLAPADLFRNAAGQLVQGITGSGASGGNTNVALKGDITPLFALAAKGLSAAGSAIWSGIKQGIGLIFGPSDSYSQAEQDADAAWMLTGGFTDNPDFFFSGWDSSLTPSGDAQEQLDSDAAYMISGGFIDDPDYADWESYGWDDVAEAESQSTGDYWGGNYWW